MKHIRFIVLESTKNESLPRRRKAAAPGAVEYHAKSHIILARQQTMRPLRGPGKPLELRYEAEPCVYEVHRQLTT